ncbi:hypothetical protein GCM10011515_26430 [Tsuneonella deserti]|uniref:CAAX prenyl protease 2/Lysostaphin resistance protein A-like domain-containing protein n=1 Tax=Tsuneonella deserti TaxID=2035528 RepID=A0ABQ1SD39_9SPHN|nr:CPBP family glutamic-type intramembrane protease [Tsuneonella deserti]GGE05600.1 hypothetical protein GCM10011515_26430 [Tsuneonella deserti]
MSGQPTRAGLPPEATGNTLVARIPGQWRAFFAFLRHPALPDRADLSLRASARALPPLFALDMALMALVLGSIGLATSLGMKMPEHMLEELKLTPLLVGFIVVGAPIAEETLFRGWLSGRPGHVLAVLALLAGGLALALVPSPALKLAGFTAGIALAVLALFVLRHRDAWGWFQRRFRWFYYGGAALFAAVHLTNFGGGSAAMLPLVLPQFMLALILGYLRVNRGLATGAALHILHNAAFVGLMLAAAS